jgi:ABC-type dipeptide/oligopeptide/nickel transport system permease component
MLAFIVRRLLWLPLLLLLVSLVTFALGLYGPGDPVQVMVGLHARPDIIERVRHDLGFDQPFYVQYLKYVGNVLTGNFGYSLVKFQGQSVGSLLAKRLPVTIQLNLVSLAWSVPLGILLGILAGVRRDSGLDVMARIVVIAGISLPIIALLPVLTFAFSRKHEFGLFGLGPFLPVGGWDGIFSDKIILPAFIEGLGTLATFTRQTRAGIIEELSKDYVRTARAKGLTEQLVVYRHVLRNALVPLATISGFLLASLVAGSFLVENWYGIPGVGQLAFESLFARDYYVIMAIVLIGATAFAFANLVIDVAYVFINPMIRYDQR